MMKVLRAIDAIAVEMALDIESINVESAALLINIWKSLDPYRTGYGMSHNQIKTRR